ncbi:MAG: FAD-dependent oxidoreductase [Oscillospiraceae bacterium]|nr:FAD-dependent oxidoreductase [Oscillospiraceae bacterium]
MDNQYAALFEPIQIGSIEIKNRFLMCPMEGTTIIGWLKGQGFVKGAQDFYLERAKDGIGLMVPGCTPLKSIIGDKWLWKNPKVFEPIKPFMDQLHSYDAKLFLQISAGWGRSYVVGGIFQKALDSRILGTLGKPLLNMDNIMVAPDEGEPNAWLPQYKCRQITRKEIKEFVEAYAQTALLAKNVGIDGVEVHAVHEGYLMDQFTMPYTNHRTDEYGGSFENRYRFAVEVVQEIKRLCGKDFPVSLRYSVLSKTKGFSDGAVPGEIYTEVGRDMEESERAIRYLEEAGYDMFSCDNGTYDAWYWAHPPVYMPLNCNLEDVEHIKQFTTKPVYCAGRMQLADGAKAVAEGKIDGVAIGRQFLVDNQVITKIREDRIDEIKPCISCHTGCLPMAHYNGIGAEFPENVLVGVTGHCALCPRSLSEKKYAVVPAKKPKKIAVIGGGIGGMEFAIQASMRGHTVELYEKSGRLGGTFIAAAMPDFKEKDKQLIEWYKSELARHPVTVHMNTEVKNLSDISADEYVIATGAKPNALPIPGWEKTVNAADYLLDDCSKGDKVAIIGGGITGCEVAYQLALMGKHPFIVETLDDLMKTKMVPAANSMLLRDLLKFHKVPTYLEAMTTDIQDDRIVVKQGGKQLELPCDTVVVSVGYSSGTPLADAKKHPKNVHIIGDAEHVANLKNAIWSANDLVIRL